MATAKNPAKNRVDKWVKRRHGTQSSPQTLNSKRIYILPSKSGAVFGSMLFVMLIGSMNYNNSMGLALTFLLGSFMLVGMHQCHRNLLGLKVSFSTPEAVFCGQHVNIPITIANQNQQQRNDLRAWLYKKETTSVNLAAQETLNLNLLYPTSQRGAFQLPRLRISCRYPGGLFCAWTWIYWDMEALVYPRANGTLSIPAPRAGIDKGNSVAIKGDEEFAELRDYQRGDNVSRVAWKQMARSDSLHTKVFEDNADSELLLDIDELQDLTTEARLEQLTQWIVAADKQNMPFALKLHDQRIDPGFGHQHVKQCLTALALYQ